MAKKKEPAEKIEIDFSKVMEDIHEPEEIRLRNIFAELRYEPGNPPQELINATAYWEDRDKYQEYLRWLRAQGKSEEDFYIGRDLNAYRYRRW